MSSRVSLTECVTQKPVCEGCFIKTLSYWSKLPVYCELTTSKVAVTFDLQNVSNLPLSPNIELFQIWQTSLNAFLRYCAHKSSGHSDLDLWPLKSNQLIRESEWTFLQTLKKICQSVLGIFTRMIWMDGWTKGQMDNPKNIMPPAIAAEAQKEDEHVPSFNIKLVQRVDNEIWSISGKCIFKM